MIYVTNISIKYCFDKEKFMQDFYVIINSLKNRASIFNGSIMLMQRKTMIKR